MIINETNVPDIVEDNIDYSKVVLADNIIKNVYPLFDEVYQSKIKYIKNLKNDLEYKKSEVRERKKELEELMSKYKKEKKISRLLTRIEKLVNAGLIYDGNLKNQFIILLKVVDKLDDERLDHHLKDTLRIIRKRFSK